MDIENLSFLTEVTDEDASYVNGGYIDYWAFADNMYNTLSFAGDSLYALGLDGSYMYDTAWAYYGY